MNGSHVFVMTASNKYFCMTVSLGHVFILQLHVLIDSSAALINFNPSSVMWQELTTFSGQDPNNCTIISVHQRKLGACVCLKSSQPMIPCTWEVLKQKDLSRRHTWGKAATSMQSYRNSLLCSPPLFNPDSLAEAWITLGPLPQEPSGPWSRKENVAP